MGKAGTEIRSLFLAFERHKDLTTHYSAAYVFRAVRG